MKTKTSASFYETKEKIAFLKSLSEKHASPDAFLPALNSIMTGIVFTISGVENKTIYRARWYENAGQFTHVSDLIYPNPEKVKIQKQRLNNFGESMFYGAISELGTIIELRPHINKFFVISTIQRRSNSKLLYHIVGNAAVPGFAFDHPNGTHKLVHRYLDSELTKDVGNPDDYNSTIAIGKILLQKGIVGGEDIENLGLAYPSVESRKIASDRTVNVAFLPRVFDKNYFISSTAIYVLTNEGTHLELNDVNRGDIDADGSINWKFSVEEMKKRVSLGLRVNDTVNAHILGLEAAL